MLVAKKLHDRFMKQKQSIRYIIRGISAENSTVKKSLVVDVSLVSNYENIGVFNSNRVINLQYYRNSP